MLAPKSTAMTKGSANNWDQITVIANIRNNYVLTPVFIYVVWAIVLVG